MKNTERLGGWGEVVVTRALRAVYDLLLNAAISAQGPGELSGDKTNDR